MGTKSRSALLCPVSVATVRSTVLIVLLVSVYVFVICMQISQWLKLHNKVNIATLWLTVATVIACTYLFSYDVWQLG